MIPTRPEDMQPDWIAGKLGAPVGSLKVTSHDKIGTGQMCDSFRLKLEWDGHDGPASIVAKCPSHDEASRNIAKMVGNYLLEINWYRELASQSLVACPPCYHAEIAENGLDFALLLGDMAPAAQGDQLAGASLTQLEAGVDQLAALHASFWNSELQNDHPWLAQGQKNKEIVRSLLPGLYEGFRQRYSERLDQEILAMGDRLIAAIFNYLDHVPAALTIAHADFRLDNLLFHPDGRAIVVDWQTVGIGCGAADLAYFIGTSVAEPATRASWEKSLFERYLAALGQQNIALDADELWLDYRLYAFSGFIMAVFASMNVERTERGDEMFAVMAERPARQALHLESLALL